MRSWILLVAACVCLLTACGASATASRSPGRFDGYVALGDSYTAAPGTGAHVGPLACGQSGRNYPRLVAVALHLALFQDHSCGGATTSDLTRGQHPGLAPQIDGLGERTRLVTVGLGANDAGLFSNFIVRCAKAGPFDPHGSPCAAAYGPLSGHRVVWALTLVREATVDALKEIVGRAPHARVLLVGYPQIVPATGGCPQLPVARKDYPWVRGVVAGLNRALRSAAASVGITYIDVWGPSAGHDICSADPWVNGSKGIPGRAAAYHPLEAEQQAVARLILEELARSGGGMPPSAAPSS